MKKVKPIEKELGCVYEYYNRDLKILTVCGKSAVILYGNSPLCLDCAKVVLSQDKSCKHLDGTGKEIKNVLEALC